MAFSNRDKQIALAIVKIFETSKPVGRSDAVAVLNDGAGFSYGTSQFTDRSGSLDKVLREYLHRGGTVGRSGIEDYLAASAPKTPSAIAKRAGNAKTKRALQDAGKTALMKQVQTDMADKLYLNPSIKACEGSGFVLPLSLAVIYDSKNHGSYDKIRDRVSVKRSQFNSDIAFEKAWITEYVKDRDAWLEGIPRLAATDYRTDFFLAQIARGNWNMNLPMTVHGVKLTADVLPADDSGSTGPDDPRNGPNIDPALIEEDSAPDDTTSATKLAKDPTERPTEDFNTGADLTTEGSAGKEQPPAPPTVEVKAATPSWTSRIGSGLAYISGLGISVGTFLQGKLEQITINHVIIIAILVGVGYAIHHFTSKRAQERTLKYIENAENPDVPNLKVT